VTGTSSPLPGARQAAARPDGLRWKIKTSLPITPTRPLPGDSAPLGVIKTAGTRGRNAEIYRRRGSKEIYYKKNGNFALDEIIAKRRMLFTLLVNPLTGKELDWADPSKHPSTPAFNKAVINKCFTSVKFLQLVGERVGILDAGSWGPWLLLCNVFELEAEAKIWHNLWLLPRRIPGSIWDADNVMHMYLCTIVQYGEEDAVKACVAKYDDNRPLMDPTQGGTNISL